MILSGVPLWSWRQAVVILLGLYILLMLLLTFAVQIVWVSARSPVLKGLEEIGKMQSQVVLTELVMSELDTQTLYHHLLEHLAPQVEAIDSRYGKDWLELDIALQPEKLLLLDQLPIWPGWQLQSFIMQPKDGSWQLSMRWQSVKQTKVPKKLPKPATNLDISTWRSMLALLPEQQITNNEDKKNLPIDYPNWQYLGYVGNQPTIGAWVREVIYSQDGQHNQQTYFFRQGEVWQDWEIISITAAQLELKRAGERWVLPSCMQLKSC
jgi:hypothetical protein